MLNFVGGVIKNAQNSGADEEQLNDLFEQATSGVLRGIKLAEKDLAGFMNEEIEKGISESKNLITQGIENLRQKIFNPEAAEDITAQQNSSITSNTNASYTKLETGELSIRTKDGDQVTIKFEDLEAFELNQLQIRQLATEQQEAEVKPSPKPTTQESTVETEVDFSNKAPNAQASIVQDADQPDPTREAVSTENSQPPATETSTNAIYYQQQSMSFSVTGELDDDELAAIGQLVSDTNDLASEFFNGDLETAFNQALELGFDEKELTGFALQLTKVENTQVIKAYEAVSHFDETNQGNEDATKAVKPVADYMDKLLNVLEGSRLQLENRESYNNIANEMINRLGDVATPDLISAINRFNEFNQKLIDNLPIGFQP
ncbi:DUF5610 domain-containing protein [Paraglaciecola aquimarina]|uniref:DUF5610 domain-containing protein n=1 Tax=Paraglaciecola aquimarina TaxID=1235557 RepID=A0ABU3ST72_9ALTE|nr:DUF5610 domain-containing protein [Paraglaciecola aquimarina]MDU0353209.1 DUF5610 domain-containing protein [Paraglaciecola aquimarina]